MEKIILSKQEAKVRNKYTVLKCSWNDFSEKEKDMIEKEAKDLYMKSNDKQASTGIKRSVGRHYIGSMVGIMAEVACLKFFKSINCKAERPEVITSKDQVDITLDLDGKIYTVEVRSSFVKNGIEFALFSTSKKTLKSYFNVLGTYRQKEYKYTFESKKNLFMCVLYDVKGLDYIEVTSNKEYFEEYLKKDNKPFYIVGGMTGDEIEECKDVRTLSTGEITKSSMVAGEYNVSPIYNIHDIEELVSGNFINKLKK